MKNNFSMYFQNFGGSSNIQTIHCNTRFFVPIIAITPFEQVLAVPALEFSVRHHRQRGEEIIKEQSWRFVCGPRQDVQFAVPKV